MAYQAGQRGQMPQEPGLGGGAMTRPHLFCWCNLEPRQQWLCQQFHADLRTILFSSPFLKGQEDVPQISGEPCQQWLRFCSHCERSSWLWLRAAFLPFKEKGEEDGGPQNDQVADWKQRSPLLILEEPCAASSCEPFVLLWSLSYCCFQWHETAVMEPFVPLSSG